MRRLLALAELQSQRVLTDMKVVVAIDSFKGSLTSLEAGQAAKAGILRALPDAQVTVRPLADGGEGTVEAVAAGMGGEVRTVTVTGPLGEPVDCPYGILPGGTAVIEMAGVAGLPQVPEEKRDPMVTTTYGVGQVIRDAIEKGCRRFIVGVGGSATNDGGAGMLQALGFGLLDERGGQIPFGAKGLAELASIDPSGALPALSACSFRVACDVTNPLCGPLGCSAVFGPQKGASPESIRQMDGWLDRFAKLAAVSFPGADPNVPGTGAAGGLGFAFLAFTNAVLEPGIQIVLEETRLEDYVRDADVVVTGEGRLDGQSVMGKAPVGVAQLAKKYARPVLAFAGSVREDASACNGAGIDAFFPILRAPMSLGEAMDPVNARNNMAAAAEQAFRLIQAARSL